MGLSEGLNPKFQGLCSKNEAAQALTPPQNDEFSIKWHIIHCRFIFLSKDFEILDFDPPHNPTSHYGACHFGYNLALKEEIIDFFQPGGK